MRDLLKDSFLVSLLIKNQSLEKGLSVKELGQKSNMTLLGFVPLPQSDYSKCFVYIEDDYYIGVDRVRIKMVIRDQQIKINVPICDNIMVINGEYEFSGETLFLEDEKARLFSKHTLWYGEHIKWMNEKRVYISSEISYVLKRNFNNTVVIANSFVCLCSYVNPITGENIYKLFSPTNLIVVIPK